MKLSKIAIRNFRLFENLEIELGDATVIIGENNAGKSALLDAVRLVLSRASARKGCAATEYDFNLSAATADPRTASPIEIELLFRELKPSEWPEELSQELNDIVQLDPNSGLSQIHLHYSAQFDKGTKAFEQKLEFLNIDGKPLKGKTFWSAVFNDFLSYVPVFYLSALRDVGEQFSPRSPFWGKLLRSVDIPDDKREQITKKLEELNTELLAIDPKLEKVTKNLKHISDVVAQSTKQDVSLRALPLRPWDLMSRSEVVLQADAASSKFPLVRHGQGVQSLAVLFLFEAFISEMLSTLYGKNATPILELEEPEAHLHPQAARSLWKQVNHTVGQKIVSTHSPYFVQNVPFHDLRILRRRKGSTTVFSLPTHYSARLAISVELRTYVSKHQDKFSIHADELRVAGRVTDDEYKDLLRCFVKPEERPAHAILKDLAKRSQSFIEPEEVLKLETYVRRMRGEVLFARCWLLCEGQTEYSLLHYFAGLLGTPLDANGVAVIDYQNNGSPGAFAALARVLGFEWIMFSDGDSAKQNFMKELANLAFNPAEVDARVRSLGADEDVEAFFASSTLAKDIQKACEVHGVKIANKEGSLLLAEIVAALRNAKNEWSYWLIDQLISRKAAASDVPAFFKEIINAAVKLANE